MIAVKCLASGSTGNSYAVDDGETVLLLEAGIPHKRMLTGYADLLPRVGGCLVTHEHGDHAKGALQLTEAGIDIYASGGTINGILENSFLRGYRMHELRPYEQITIGTWIVLPWQAQHDATDPLGYLLYSTATQERLLFATDTFFVPNKFHALNYIMVECNYDYSQLMRNVEDGIVPASMVPRLMRSHFSLDNVRAFLSANDLSHVRRIYLIHVSNQNGDKRLFKRDIVALTGKPVTVF